MTTELVALGIVRAVIDSDPEEALHLISTMTDAELRTFSTAFETLAMFTNAEISKREEDIGGP